MYKRFMLKDIYCNNIFILWIPLFCASVVIFYFHICDSHYIAAIFALGNYILKWLKIGEECLLNIPPVYFGRSLCRSKILSGIKFLLPEELFLTFSCSTSLLVINSFSFCLFEKLIFLLYFWKIYFSEYRVLGNFFFSSSTLKLFLHCLLACILSEEKSAVFLIFVPLYIVCFFPHWLLSRFPLVRMRTMVFPAFYIVGSWKTNYRYYCNKD